MRSQEEYDDGIPLNQFNYWYDNGQKAKEIIYSPHGGIHSNMPIEERSFWISGGGVLPRGFIKHYKSWYLNGQIREESDFVDKRRYVVKKWHENGQQKLEYHIDREANKVGFTYTKFWNELGEEDKKAYGDAFNEINRHQRERKILIVTAEGFWVQDFYKNGKKASNIFFTKYEPNENLFHGIHYGEQYKRYYCFDGVIELFDLDGTKTNEITCSKNNQYIKSTINSSTYIPNYKLQEKRLYLRSEFDSKGFPIGPDKAIGISKTWYENGQLFNEFDHDKPEKSSNFIKYYPNGQIKEERKGGVNIIYGTHHGDYLLKAYGKSDRYGSIRSYWHKNKKVMEYKLRSGAHGESFGIISVWHENGQLAEKGKFDLEKKEGVWKYFYDDGKPWMVGEYSQDKQVGVWCYWDRAGNQKEVHYNEK